jgi:hypothetical protein
MEFLQHQVWPGNVRELRATPGSDGASPYPEPRPISANLNGCGAKRRRRDVQVAPGDFSSCLFVSKASRFTSSFRPKEHSGAIALVAFCLA